MYNNSSFKTILVTGGAGEIGSAICRKFAAKGYAVIVTYNSNTAKAEKLLVELNDISKNLTNQSTNKHPDSYPDQSTNSHSPNTQSTKQPINYFPFNIHHSSLNISHSIFHAPTTNPEKVAELKAFVAEKYGKLDVLVNNAGITTPVPHDDLENLTDEWIDKIMQTNFRGSFAMCRAMKDLLAPPAPDRGAKNLLTDSVNFTSGEIKKAPPSEEAVIVNISSIAGIYGIGSNVAYCASKAALDSMTRSLGALAPQIRVVSVSPGFVEGEYTKSFDPSFLQSQKSNTPLQRFATGDDVANAVFALATQLTFSTGNIITIDGGRLLM